MSLFLNFVFIFHTFFTFHKYCLFHYWIWAIKCRLRKSMPILRTFSYLWRYKSSRSWYSWEAILKNSRNCREITCARVPFLIKLQPATLLKKRLWHMLTKFLRIAFCLGLTLISFHILLCLIYFGNLSKFCCLGGEINIFSKYL